MKKTAFEKINCAFCVREYEANIYLDQGAGFAAFCFGSAVIAHYGSEFDGLILLFEQPVPEPEPFCGPSAPVCDECIRDWIASGTLVEACDWFNLLYGE